MPNKTLVTSREKEAKAFKKPKDRVTIMACANASGTIKLPLVFIHKFANPDVSRTSTRMTFQCSISTKEMPGWTALSLQIGLKIVLFHCVGRL